MDERVDAVRGDLVCDAIRTCAPRVEIHAQVGAYEHEHDTGRVCDEPNIVSRERVNAGKDPTQTCAGDER